MVINQQVANLIFRMGANATLFSGNPGLLADRYAKYQLVTSARVSGAHSEDGYGCIRCVFQH